MKSNHSLFAISGILAASLVAVSTAVAQDKHVVAPPAGNPQTSPFYIDISGGAGFSDELELRGGGSHFDTGFSAGGAAGMRMGDFRFEIEGAYRSNDVNAVQYSGGTLASDGEVSAWSIMANFAIDFPIADRLSMYAGAGLGIAGVDLEFAGPGGRFDDDNTALAWQVFAGLSYEMSEQMETYFGYRLFRAEDIDFDSGLNADDYQTHGIVGGVRITF